MSKLLVVFGATGRQGGSVINYVLEDAELSKQYRLRAVTRNVQSANAKRLKDQIEVVQGDVTDRPSLDAALAGAHTVFAVTAPDFGPNGFQVEFNNAKAIADATVAAGAEHLIFSTLPSVSKITNGKYTSVTPFDAKAAAEEYIRGLPIKSAFYLPGLFMQNLQSQPFLAPVQVEDGTWVLARHTSPKTQMPYIDAAGDTGKFIGAILANPDKYEGKTFRAAAETFTLEDLVKVISKATGKKVVYKQVSVEQFKKDMVFEPVMFADVFAYQEEYGYFGPGTEESIAWSKENARGRLATLEEYLEANPWELV